MRVRDRFVINFTPMEENPSGKSGGRGVINFIAMQENPSSESGRPGTVYLVNERDSYVVVAQLSPEFAAAIVDHWRELKGENREYALQLLANRIKEVARYAE